MTEKPEDGSDFIVTGDKDKLQPKEAEEEKKEEVIVDILPFFASFDSLNDEMSRPRIPMELTKRRLLMCKMTTSWRQVCFILTNVVHYLHLLQYSEEAKVS